MRVRTTLTLDGNKKWREAHALALLYAFLPADFCQISALKKHIVLARNFAQERACVEHGLAGSAKSKESNEGLK